MEKQLKIFRFMKRICCLIFLLSFFVCSAVKADMYRVDVPVLNLRVCASTECKILRKLPKGEIVDTISETGNWFKVRTQKSEGYVIKKSLKKVPEKEHSVIWKKIFIFVILLGLCSAFADRIREKKLTGKQPEMRKTKMAKNAFRTLTPKGEEIFRTIWDKREKKASRVTAYDVLEIAPTDSQNEIKRAYKTVVKKYHPDVNADKDAASKFRKIKKAYNLLSDTFKKAQYDKTLVSPSLVGLYVGFSVQELRHVIAADYNIDSKTIKFTQTGDVFINDEFANCWCEINKFFVYYKPLRAKELKFDPMVHEIIFLTSYDMYNLQEMIAVNFGCETEAIELEYTGESSEYAGVVLKYGEYALCWRETEEGFYEFYCPTIPEEPKRAYADEIPDEYDFSDDEDEI